MNKTTPYIAIAAVLIIATGLYVYTKPGKQAETVSVPEVAEPITAPAPSAPVQAEEPPMPAPAPEPEKPVKPALIAPPPSLDTSDAAVINLVNNLSPELTAWLVPEEQIRKWVLTVDLLAEGKTPRKYQPLNYPMPKFSVTKEDGKIYPDESNFNRASRLIEVIEKIEPTKVAEYIRYWQPLGDSAYGELGKDGQFLSKVKQALDQILNAKPQPENPVLVQPSVFFMYEDKELQNSSDIQKLLWRIGPDNTQKVQDYARKLRDELNK